MVETIKNKTKQSKQKANNMSHDTTAEQSNELIDFDFNSDNVELGYPKVKPGNYPMKVDKTYTKPNNAQTGKNLIVEFVNSTPITSLQKDAEGNARVLEPGHFRLKLYCPMQDSGKMKPGQFMERITEIHRACGGTGKPTTGDWVGKTVEAKVALDPQRLDENTGKTYDESNAIKSVAKLR